MQKIYTYKGSPFASLHLKYLQKLQNTSQVYSLTKLLRRIKLKINLLAHQISWINRSKFKKPLPLNQMIREL